MEIEPVLYRDHLEVYLRNTSLMELRLWELWNSWGWWSISFQIRDEQDSGVYTIKHTHNHEWTKNGPTYFVIAPNERYGIYIDLNDGWWERDQAISF